MSITELIDQYNDGIRLLVQAVAGMTDRQLDMVPIPGMWSTRQVVCHIADFESVYAERMKRVIAETQPNFFGADPDTFAARLAYQRRDIDVELQIVAATRKQMSLMLKSLNASDFDRIGNHNEAGPLRLSDLLQGIAEHLPHHVHFIEQKRQAMR
jgi:hypothetical protein